MKWKIDLVSTIKQLAVGVSVVTMCLSPVAQGAQAQSNKALVNEYLKQTGWTKKDMTVGEYWRSVRHVYPREFRHKMDLWVMKNRLEPMPSIVDATSFKDANGVEQVRLVVRSSNGENTTLTFTGDDDVPLKINNVRISHKELYNYKKMDQLLARLVKEDPKLGKPGSSFQSKITSPVLTAKEYRKLTVRQRAEYMIRMRKTLEAAEKVLEVKRKYEASTSPENKYEFVLNSLFGDYAFAASLSGQPCIVAGYISKYGKSNSCGSDVQNGALNADLKGKISNSIGSGKNTCSSINTVPCNPFVYGYSREGAPFCVPRAQMNSATKWCNEKAPIKTAQDKKNIIETYLKNSRGKNIDLVLNAEGKISDQQMKEIQPFLDDLKAFVQEATKKCESPPLNQIVESRPDQYQACVELSSRAITLDAFALAPEPIPVAPVEPNPQQPVQTCEDEIPGSYRDEAGVCVTAPAEGDLVPGKPDEEDKKKCGVICFLGKYKMPLLLLAGGIGIAALISKSKDKKPSSPVYVPPAPVPEPSPTPTVTPDPCPAPNTLIGGICTPPVVVEPPTYTEGGTTIDTGIKAGGTR